MTGFPDLPVTRGDTDDEASVHPDSRVGPAVPMNKSKFDQKIKSILRDKTIMTSDNSKASHDFTMSDSDRLNGLFDHFILEKSTSVTQSDESTVEVPRIEASNKEPKPTSARPEKQSISFLKSNLRFAGFVIGALVILLGAHFFGEIVDSSLPSRSSIHKRLEKVEVYCEALRKDIMDLDIQVGEFESKQNDSIGCSNLDGLKDTILDEVIFILKKESGEKDLDISVEDNNVCFDSSFESESSIGPYTDSHADFHNDSHADSHTDSHADSHTDSHTDSHNDFHTGSHADSHTDSPYISIVIDEEADHKTMVSTTKDSKTQETQSGRQQSGINPLTGARPSGWDSSPEQASFEIENHMYFENYASYSSGARIIWYLTTTQIDDTKNQNIPVARKLFSGWSGFWKKYPPALETNANNILFSNGHYWNCGSSSCSVGIRLPKPVFITDIIIHTPLVEKPVELAIPATVSIYVKPDGRTQDIDVSKYPRDEFQASRSMRRFVKVKEQKILDRSQVHVPFSSNESRMNFYVREIVLKLECDERSTGLFNVEVRGITNDGVDQRSITHAAERMERVRWEFEADEKVQDDDYTLDKNVVI